MASEFEIDFVERACKELFANADNVLTVSNILVVLLSEVNTTNPEVVVEPCTTSALYLSVPFLELEQGD